MERKMSTTKVFGVTNTMWSIKWWKGKRFRTCRCDVGEFPTCTSVHKFRVSWNAALVWINLRVAWQTLTLSLWANSCIWDCHKMNVNNASLKAKKIKAVPRWNSLFCRFSLKLIELRLLCSPQNHFTTTSRWGVLINIQAGCVRSWKTKGYGAFTISILQCLFVLYHLAKMKMQSYSTRAPVSQSSSDYMKIK